MKTIYHATVEFQTDLMIARRKFFFDTESARNTFTNAAQLVGVSVTGTGIEHLLSAQEAAQEVIRERGVATRIATGAFVNAIGEPASNVARIADNGK